nr:malectin [Acidiferrobacterales bacterium]
AEMLYSIPLLNDDYVVRLYLGNGWDGTDAVGDRVFDINIENLIAINDLDLIAMFGHEVGGVVEVPVSVSDGVLNIEFVHQVQNPLINAIEVLASESF